MTTIQIEAEVSAEQLLRAVEQLPPAEFAALLARLLDRARSAARAGSAPIADGAAGSALGRPGEQNPYLAAAGMFADDSFAAEAIDTAMGDGSKSILAQRPCALLPARLTSGPGRRTLV